VKYKIRVAWILTNLIAATVVVGVMVLLVGFFDTRKKFVGSMPRWWSKWVLWSSGLEYEVSGLEKLDPDAKYVFVGNHESALDIPVAVACLPYNIVFLAKKELFRIPLFGWGMYAAGMVRVDRQNREKAGLSIDRAVRYLKRSCSSVLVYPEGTRSRTGELGRFKKGSFLLAIKTQLPVVPVTIIGSREVLPRNSFKFRRKKIRLKVGAPILTQGLTEDKRDELLRQTYAVISVAKQGTEPDRAGPSV